MHFLMYVTMSLPEGTTSEEARQTVYSTLLEDESFCGSGGRFHSALSDWFIIGGRWSGMLAETSLGFEATLTARFPELVDVSRRYDFAEKNRSEFDAIWMSCGGTSPNPYSRSNSDELGYPDDAMPLTQQLYDSHLKNYLGHEIYGDDSHYEYVDLDFEALDPDFIGRKWLVIVDYHS